MIDRAASNHLQTLGEHQEYLNRTFATACDRVLIMSPYASINAIKSDNLSTLVQEAVARGVQVKIYIDSRSNSYADGTMTDRAVDGIEELIQAGATVAVVNGLQSKLIACDNAMLAQGEFNWLSAIRIRSGECSLKEPTQVFTGEAAATRILQELERIEEAGYGFAMLQKNNEGLEITTTGKWFGLISILILPPLIGNNLGYMYAGLVFTAVILIIGAFCYGLKTVRSPAMDPAQQN